MFALPPTRVLFGAAYYHEYQPYDRLKDDLDLMAEARFTVIRVGESVWSTWEPENGRFDLDWLQPVLDGAHERGISVILGTPTYAVPPWLARQYPEIAGEYRTGERHRLGRPPGGRLHPPGVPASTPSGSSARSSAGTPTTPPSSASRSTTNRACTSSTTTASSSASPTNCANGTATSRPSTASGACVYWSHRLSTWADLWTPGRQRPAAVRPGLAALPGRGSPPSSSPGRPSIVREYARPDQFVTTCISYDRQGVEDDTPHRRELDVTAGNPYYAMQDALALPDRNRRRAGLDDQRHLGAVPQRRPHVLLPPGAVPGHGDQRAGHRRALGQPAPPTTASGARPPGRWSPAAPR